MNKRYWLLAAFVLVAIAFFQHRSTPSMALPENAAVSQDTVRVPVTLSAPLTDLPFFGLVRKGTGQYLVAAYQNKKMISEFPTTQTLQTTLAGTLYAAVGDIRLDGATYKAIQIFVGSDHKTGYIVFRVAN